MEMTQDVGNLSEIVRHIIIAKVGCVLYIFCTLNFSILKYQCMIHTHIQQPQLIVRRGRVLTLLIRLGPLLVIWPLIVNLIMLYLSKRYITLCECYIM